MALYSVATGATIQALDTDQYYNLLTGVMTDQPVTLGNALTVNGTPTFKTAPVISLTQAVTLTHAATAARTVTLPDTTDTLVALAMAQTLTNKTLTAPVLTAPSSDYYKATGITALGSKISARYVGSWSTVGTPTGLTAVVGDYGFDGNGTLWYCTGAGTPGTWRPSAPGLIGTASPGGSASGTVTIPAGYRDLDCWVNVPVAAAGADIGIRFNNDSTANYDYEVLEAGGTSAVSGANSVAATYGRLGFCNSGGFGTSLRVGIPDYAGTVMKKNYFSQESRVDGEALGSLFTGQIGGHWRAVATTAITSLVFIIASGTFPTGTTITVYGTP